MRVFTVRDRGAVHDFITAGRSIARHNGSPLPNAASERSAFNPKALDKHDEKALFLLAPPANGAPIPWGARALLVFPRFDSTARLGWFESIDDAATALPLLEHAATIAASRGAARILGPLDIHTWQRYRLVTGGWGPPPFVGEPQNPAWYPALFKAAGFTEVERYVSALCTAPHRHIAKAQTLCDRYYSAGYRIRPFNPHKSDAELRSIHDISLQAFPGGVLFRPLSFPEFKRLYKPILPFLHPGLCAFAVDPQGNDIGFVFGLPDYYALRERDGSLRAKLRTLALRLAPLRLHPAAHYDRVILKTLAVRPGLRHVMPGPVLGSWLNQQVLDLGLSTLVHALMHEDNYSRTLSAWSAEPFRSYALFGKDL